MQNMLCSSYRCPMVAYLMATLCLLLADVIHLSYAAEPPVTNELPTLSEGPDFKVTALIKVIRQLSNEVDLELVVTEYYSNNQRRARLDINRPEATQETEIRYYSNDVRMLRVNYTQPKRQQLRPTPSCQLANSNLLAQDMFGELSSVDLRLRGADWLRAQDKVPGHAIGITRLLFIMAANKDKLISGSTVGNTIRNHNVNEYKLSILLDSNEKQSIMKGFYAINEADRWTSTKIPLRISVLLSSGAEIVADFTSVEPIEYSRSLNEPINVGLFTFPLGIGCSAHLEPANLLSSHTVVVPRVASFRAEVYGAIKNIISMRNSSGIVVRRKHFIAYDGLAKSLRVDSIRTYSSIRRTIAQDDNERFYTIAIHDMNRDLKFNIRHRLPSSSIKAGWKRPSELVSKLAQQSFDYSIELMSEQSFSSQCVVAGLVDGTMHSNPYEPALPFEEFVEMGPATCRGALVRTFEHQATALPPLLFHLFSQGVKPSAELGAALFYLPYSSSAGGNYTIVYYFAEASLAAKSQAIVGPLMQVDVVEQGAPLFRAQIFNFAWQLTKAPNGDHQDELFNLGDRCSGKEPQAQLKLVLEYRKLSPRSYSAESVFELIRSHAIRNKSLLRAITADSGLAATQIRQIESRLHLNTTTSDGDGDGDSKLIVQVSVKVSDRKNRVYNPLMLGGGFIRQTQVESLVSTATSLDECFWDSVHSKEKNVDADEVVFTFCFGNCLIDTKAKLDLTSEGRPNLKSMIFGLTKQLGKSSPCLLYKLSIDDSKVSQAKELAERWKLIRMNLKTKVFRLPIVNVSTNSIGPPAKYLAFEVKQTELTNDKWLTSLDDTTAHWSDSDGRFSEGLIKGLGLWWPSELVQRIKPNSISFKGQQEGGESSAMNFDSCHSSCMANLDCSSFSICISGQEVECLQSNVSFRDASLLSEIKSKIGDSKGNKKTSISVNLNSNTETSREIKLRVDRRCCLYNKNPLEMFHRPKKVTSKIDSKYLYPTDSEEDCAQLCLNANMRFFRRLANSTFDILQDGQKEKQELQRQLIEQRSEHAKSWCTRFFYLPISELPAGLRDKLSSDKLIKNGLCQLKRPNWSVNMTQANNATTSKGSRQGEKTFDVAWPPVRLQFHEFIYSLLFERQYGISLMESKFTLEDNLKFRTNNQIISFQSEVEVCARACFSQSIGLKPWCRSFDFVEDRSKGLDKDSMRFQIITYCVFNSMTLAEAQRSDLNYSLITTDMPADIKFWHYEPKKSFTLDDLVWTRLQEKDTQLEKGNDTEQGKEEKSPSFRMKKFGTLIVIIVALVTGWILGVNLGHRIESRMLGRRRESVSNPSRSFLSSLIGGDISSDTWHKRFDEDFDLPELSMDNTNAESARL